MIVNAQALPITEFLSTPVDLPLVGTPTLGVVFAWALGTSILLSVFSYLLRWTWYDMMDGIPGGIRGIILILGGVLLWGLLAAVFKSMWEILEIRDGSPGLWSLWFLLLAFWAMYRVLWPEQVDRDQKGGR